MIGKVLIDTSVWIEFFRKNKPRLYEFVATLLREGHAIGTGIVSMELLRGSKTQKEVTVVSELFETVEMVYQSPSTYINAGNMGYQLARKGHTISIVDLLIAQLVIENCFCLLTLDKHFDIIDKNFPLNLIAIPE